MASTHDIQELDVSSILATQILTWIDEDEVETKGYVCVSVCEPVHSPVKVTGSYRRACRWGSCFLLNPCYNFNVQKAFWNSASASVASALTIFWWSTHVTTAPPSTERRRTLTVASGHPSTCRGSEECRRAAVHLWWALGPDAARDDSIYNPHLAFDSKLRPYPGSG